MISKVNAVVLFVEDLNQAMRFYRDMLELEIVVTDDVSFAFSMEGQDFALVHVSAGIRMLNEDVFKEGFSRRVMLCADVENVDAIYEKLTANGLVFIKAPIDQVWGWRTAYFADPEGNIWELRQGIPPQ